MRFRGVTQMKMNLEELGWSEFQETQRRLTDPDRKWVCGRVVEEQKDLYKCAHELSEIEFWIEIPGRYRHELAEGVEGLLSPVVGDWILFEARIGEQRGTLKHVFKRQSQFSRRAVGSNEREQMIASNVQVACIVTSLNQDLNLRRIERYLALVWHSGAIPVIVLTKSDLREHGSDAVAKLQSLAPGVEVLQVSSVSREGLPDLVKLLRARQTIVFLGSSGVGKSTLVNVLMEREMQATYEVRESDDRGRHTTTSRRLLKSPTGFLLIDTPGMRELQLWDAEDGIDATFADIEGLARSCRFGNCGHESEPGCGIVRALKEGSLDEKRWQNYLKLQNELAFHERKRDKAAQSAQKKKWKRISAELRRSSRSHRRF